MRITGTKIDFFTSLYEDTKNKLGEEQERFDKWYSQYKGSDIMDGSGIRATVVRNMTYELIESQVSTDIPAPKVTACRYNPVHNRCAISAERLLNQLRDRLPYEVLNDIDERYTYILGGSVWLVEWDEGAGDREEHGGIRLTVINPRDFFPQPNIFRQEDLEYAFVRYNTTREDVEDRYGVRLTDVSPTDQDPEITPHTDDDGTVTVVVCYYKRDRRICKYVFCGDVELEDMDDYYARRVRKCAVCGKYESDCQCGDHAKIVTEHKDFETIYEDIKLSDGRIIPAWSPALNEDGTIRTHKVTKPVLDDLGSPVTCELDGMLMPLAEDVEEPVMEQTTIEYFVPDVLPFVIRKNTSEDMHLLGQSDCEYIRPQQQAINKIESRIMQKLMRSSVTPVVPDGARVSTNEIFGQVIRLKEGETAHQYGVVDTRVDVSADAAQADRIYQYTKKMIGITDSYQGNSEYAGQSGEAIKSLQQMSAGRIESKRRMKRAAYADVDRVIWQMYLAYADEPRVMQYIDPMGITQDAEFNRYDFLDMDEVGRWHYYTGYAFSVDSSGGMEQDRKTIWEINLTNLKQGALGNPADPRTLLRYWMMQERAHYPNASDNVQYFTMLIQQMQSQAQAQAQAQAVSPAEPAGMV